MNIKHRNLEQIRKSPKSVSEFSNESGKGGKTMIRVWDHAIGHYHHDGDAKAALSYLINGLSQFNDNKKNREWKEKLIDKFNCYINSYTKLKLTNVKVNSRLKIDIHHNNFITGEIFRIDKSSENGYIITIQNRKDEIWAHELRFRLLQIHFSNLYKCPYDLIKVGVYNFENGEHEYVSFDDIELRNAWDETINISNKINQIRLS